jgi:adenylate cyclase
MGVEIERKFLVRAGAWQPASEGVRYQQGYLSTHPARTVRVRRAGWEAFLTIKGSSVGAARAEYEYPLPLADAVEMLENLCEKPLIDKTRHKVPFAGHTWEVDIFHGDNEGLVVAEVELDQEGEAVELPPWVGAEETGDPRYANSSLVARPFRTW